MNQVASVRSGWMVVPRPRPDAELRLFCFPHAAGAASAYAGWAAGLPGTIEVVAVQPPGREERVMEPLIAELDALVEAVDAALEPMMDRPFAFFGHSTGALVAFELTRRLRARGRSLPVHLFASGRWAPHLRDPEPPICDLPLDEMVAALRRYGGTPEELLASREVMEFFLPLFRADFALGDRYAHTPGAPLDVPLTALGGVDDAHVSLAALEAWGDHTTAAFHAEQLAGGHFFLHEQRDAVLRRVADALRETRVAR